MITFEEIKNNEHIKTYIKKADESLIALGYTEHSFAHVTKVSEMAKEILLKLGYPKREAELAQIAGYLHDIGNVINRVDHAQSGAVMAFRILDKLGAEPEEIATIITAIGNHDEGTAVAVNPVAAALGLAVDDPLTLAAAFLIYLLDVAVLEVLDDDACPISSKNPNK